MKPFALLPHSARRSNVPVFTLGIAPFVEFFRESSPIPLAFMIRSMLVSVAELVYVQVTQ